ncbi:Probable ABC transporter ATP-binding protein HI_0664 [uncultured Clostridium sp.]|uniref:amino acid ABC transporter ATP-binding/permease protein n=1 Tax=uncultured Clostridium sp. TaxID=59620 RepID=UPI0008230E0C|nr:ABC transporter ATP-binding protein [uncultured Clostridium sp.]SCJ97697.1 Probable ABC transporter ATP-binding protein HI_0664 [uncultured Clostridium sp.]
MQRRSGFQIMKRLIIELKPLAPIMAITISMGVVGFLAAIAIASFGAIAIGTLIGDITFISFTGAMVVMALAALFRGFLRYAEQLSGHYIAFKILYILRDKIFAKLRKLAPAKLEGQEKGNLISLITSDIELLEVFYAHTIAPISIAIITNTIISIILFMINPWFGLLSVVFFLIVGFVIPYASSSLGKEAGVAYRNMFGECNNYILDSLRGLKEVLLFKNGEERLKEINSKSHRINESLDKIKEHEGIIRAITDLTIMIAILTFVGLGFYQYSIGSLSFTWMLVGIVIIASSFGPVVALSNLSNTLLQTFACAERLFDLIDEEPHVEEVLEGHEISGDSISYEDVTFAYPNRKEKIFDATSVHIEKGDKIALIGESGIGKSTFVKLMMRFWDVNEGKIKLDNKNIKEVNTNSIRNTQTLVSQETYLFNESILDNIRIGNVNATKDEVIKATKMASIHDFIETLPKGYDTKVGELGGNLSSGEKQRIGLARAFLSDGDVLILDEPTSNLDTLNEGEILKSIKENCEDKTIVLISHRKSTTAVCNKTYKLENSKLIMN